MKSKQKNKKSKKFWFYIIDRFLVESRLLERLDYVLSLQQNTPITTKMIIVVIHVLLHQFIRFHYKSYFKTSNLLLKK